MKNETPTDLFFDQMLDLYSVESQLMTALPALTELADYPPLVAMLTSHAKETLGQADAICKILMIHGFRPAGDKCKAMQALLSSGDATLRTVNDRQTRDLMLVAHCLRIEHYEVAAYNITSWLARALHFDEETIILRDIMEEEREAAGMLHHLQPALFELATALPQP
jgi:ferritin-like metal-binding protein YciE